MAGDRRERLVDNVAVEEPLEIRISYWFKESKVVQSLAVTMRTPGHDRELAAGFLFSEGIITTREQLVNLRPLGGDDSDEIIAELYRDVDVESWRLSRHSFVSSSCGVCGKRSREAIAESVPEAAGRFGGDEVRVRASAIWKLPEHLRDHQAVFARTGGLHAAALFTTEGAFELSFEDIGRHNALDKLIGHCVLNNHIPLENKILFMSSRSSFELVQKSVVAGISVLATVGSPSSLAIETARDCGLTLIGFVRDDHFNIYSGEWRIN
jgi:FdhD protein